MSAAEQLRVAQVEWAWWSLRLDAIAKRVAREGLTAVTQAEFLVATDRLTLALCGLNAAHAAAEREKLLEEIAAVMP